MFTCENLIVCFILTIMSDTGTDSDCTIIEFDIFSESDNNNGDVDVHVDDNKNTFCKVLTLVLLIEKNNLHLCAWIFF